MLDVHSPDDLSPHLGLVQVVYGHLGLFRLGQLNQDQGSVLLIKRKLNSINFAVRGEEGEEVVALSFGLAYVGHKQDAARGAEVPSQVGKSHGSQGISPHLTVQGGRVGAFHVKAGLVGGPGGISVVTRLVVVVLHVEVG